MMVVKMRGTKILLIWDIMLKKKMQIFATKLHLSASNK